jgi:phenylalanyl-tRNA synthetase beta chain
LKISLNWLREFVDLKVDDRQLAEDLTMAGVSVETVSGEGENFILDFEITTNRPDEMNHYGIARECSAIYDLDLKPLRADLPAAKGTPKFAIEIADPDLCARYTAQIVRGVNIQPSPAPIARRLEMVDARPINNGVDASNYTLIEMGHPTHAFDLDTLQGGKIVVRRARPGETLKTLDGVDRKLHPDDLVIADGNRPVALAGVMGGFDTMITERTRNILIESAWFDPVSVRLTAKRHGMHTDASHRFERGADWGATPLACARVAQLILKTGGGTLEGGQIDAIGRSLERPSLPVSRTEVRRILGQDIGEQEITHILRRLGFGLTAGRSSTVAVPSSPPLGSGGTGAAIAEEPVDFTVTIPTWRLDVEREIDVIEEIARIYGYNRFPNTLPAYAGSVVETSDAAKDAAIRSTLLALGYNEAISLTFDSRAEATAFSSAQPVEIANPLSQEAAVMRTSMLPGMLHMLEYNLNRGTDTARLFEAGKVYELLGNAAAERKQVAIGTTGLVTPASVHQTARAYSFFDLKGDVEALLREFQHKSLYFDAHAAAYYHPGRSARAVLDGGTVAQFGQLHPAMAAERKLRQEVLLAEIYLDRLYRHELRRPVYRRLSRFPAVDRDFSCIFDDSVTFERIRGSVDALQIAELQSFVPVEIFRGGAIPAGKYSVLLRAEFQSAERTLRDDEVALWAQQVITAVQSLGGQLRAN